MVDATRVRLAVRRNQDALVAVVMLVLGEWQVVAGADGAGDPRVAGPAIVVFCSAIALRRLHALTAASVVAATWLTSSLLGSSPMSIWALVLALVMSYSAAAYATSRRRAVMGLGLLLAAAYAGAWLEPHSELGDRLFTAPVLIGGPWAAGVLTRRFREQAQLLTVLNAELVERRAHDAEEAAHRERTRIARELHDVVSHGLGMITVQAAAALRMLDVDPERARLPLEDIRKQGKEALTDMRTMLGLLADDPGATEQPGLDSLPGLLERLGSAGLTVAYDARSPLPTLDPEQQLVAYRVVQEAVTNALRHGDVSRLDVRVHTQDGRVRVEVDDNGTAQPGTAGTGRGLVGMHARAAQVGGQVEAGPRAEGGWRVILTLPTPGIATP